MSVGMRLARLCCCARSAIWSASLHCHPDHHPLPASTCYLPRPLPSTLFHRFLTVTLLTQPLATAVVVHEGVDCLQSRRQVDGRELDVPTGGARGGSIFRSPLSLPISWRSPLLRFGALRAWISISRLASVSTCGGRSTWVSTLWVDGKSG